MDIFIVLISHAGIFLIWIVIARSQRSNSKTSIPRDILLWLHDGMDCETCGLDSPKANIMSIRSQKNVWNQKSKEWEPLTKGIIAGHGKAPTIPPPKKRIADHSVKDDVIFTYAELPTRKRLM